MEELREVVFVLSRQLEIRLSNWKIPLSILPRMVEALPVILFPHVAHGRPQFVPSSVRPELRCGVRLLALWDHKGHVFVGFTIDGPTIFSWDMTADLDAIHTSIRFLHNLPSESTACESFKSSTWINVSKSLIFFCCFFSRMSSSTGSHNNWWSLRLFESFLVLLESDHFHSPYDVKLPSPQWILSLSFDEVTEGEDTLLAEPGLKNLCRFSEYEPETLYKFVCKIQAAILAVSSKFKVYSIDSIFDVADFDVQSGWLPEQVLISPLWERTCSRDAEVSLDIGSCHPTELSVITSVSHHSMKCE